MRARADTSSLAEHVMACIENQKAAAVGASRPPPAVHTSSPSGSGSSSMDPQHADQGAQPPPFDPSNINHVEHFVACIEQQDAAAAGTSHPPPVHTRASPGSGPTTSMDIETADPQAQPLLLPVQTRATTGSGSASMDIETADLGAQLPPLPSAPSCPAGSSSGGESRMDEPSKHLARMIALRGYDPSIIDDDCFRSFLGSLNSEFTMPSRIEIEKECDHVFDEARRDLLSKLSNSRGRVSLAVGRTKIIIDNKEVMYITCHFIDNEWMLRMKVIGAFLFADDHNYYSGPMLGVYMHDYSDGWDDLIETTLSYMSSHGVLDRVSMLAYETNGKDFCTFLKNSILSDTRSRNKEICCTTYVDKVLHHIAQCILPNDLELEIGLSLAVERLDLTREERQQLISYLALDDPWMYHDQPWYGMYCSLKVLRMESSNANDTNSFGELLSNVCDRRKHLVKEKYDDSTSDFSCKVWKAIHHAIQRISSPSYPTSHLCLGVLLNMLEFLQYEFTQLSIPNRTEDRDVFANGLREAIEILDEAIKDSYLVWSIPLALDPRYKLEHICSIFQKAFGPLVGTEYYSKVTKMITDLYHGYRTDEFGTSTDAGHSDTDANYPMHQRKWPAELTNYIRDPAPPADDFDILKWWKRNSQKYPTLVQMATDALAMPTCSKPSSGEIAQIKSSVRGYSRKSFS